MNRRTFIPTTGSMGLASLVPRSAAEPRATRDTLTLKMGQLDGALLAGVTLKA